MTGYIRAELGAGGFFSNNADARLKFKPDL